MTDPRITRNIVLEAIYSKANAKRTIWSPCTTLEVMKIEWYPHLPKTNRLAMKRVLHELCSEGLIEKRPEIHSHYTFKEVAYERISLGKDV